MVRERAWLCRWRKGPLAKECGWPLELEKNVLEQTGRSDRKLLLGNSMLGRMAWAGLLLSYLKCFGFRAQHDSGVQTLEGLPRNVTQEF